MAAPCADNLFLQKQGKETRQNPSMNRFDSRPNVLAPGDVWKPRDVSFKPEFSLFFSNAIGVVALRFSSAAATALQGNIKGGSE